MPRKTKRRRTEEAKGPRQLAIAANRGVWTGLHAFHPSTMSVGFVDVGGQPFAVIEVPTASALPISTLTPTERVVLALVLAGKSSSEIAAERSVAERTVINQISAIYRKLGVSGRAELTVLATKACR